MFDDQGIERSHTIAPELMRAIKGSRISIVVLSKNYASSSWCLNELVKIFECKKDTGQIVMTIFYDVDPSDVRKQTGDFGKVFKKTCAHKTREERRRWSKALDEVGNIAGEHFQNWDNEAKMIEKIAKDVLDKLNATPSRDFDGMVGLEAHLKKMEDLLDLDYDGVKMVAISGPAGIGKTTIARALHSRLSNRFQLTCFVDNLRGSYQSGFDEYELKMRLQEQFLSKVLNNNVFFNYQDGDLVKAMFADRDLDVKRGLKILVYRSLIEISTDGKRIEMHRLLQQVGRKAIRKQEPWKRQILIDGHEICNVLENETGTSDVSGISFDISRIKELIVSKKAFKTMSNLQFLSVYKRKADWNERMFIPEEMEFPRRLKLLHWEAYPNKCLPPTFHLEYLVELDMQHSRLEYLWQGTWPLANLKKMDFSSSSHLKELPDLSNATNMEELNLKEMPAKFEHRARGNSLTIRPDGKGALDPVEVKFYLETWLREEEDRSRKLLTSRGHSPIHVTWKHKRGEGALSAIMASVWRCFRDPILET
ncbi:hypothetical protein AALP_AA2G003000 [Arabis alpina]|uniref:TIR domain-containing protein n=1 Tax=Arabis alpina TaxID=50452 RepID=A0A087HEE2_ARAAL|nr:hypothetical protein AALP_AA2G003000 [Arabis alpina]